MNRAEEENAPRRPDENCDRWHPIPVADCDRRALASIIGRLRLSCSRTGQTGGGSRFQECSMINFRCSIEHSTLNIEHYGYCRFTPPSWSSSRGSRIQNVVPLSTTL